MVVYGYIVPPADWINHFHRNQASHTMSAGRHRVLDESKCREICALVTVGCSIQAAARYVGCSRNTIRREAARNEEFADLLRYAEIEARIRPVRTMQEASGTHWRAAAWLLERTQPEEYARAAANLIKIETVQDFVARALEVIAAELSDSPENQAVARRLTHAIDSSCGELTVAALTSRDPKRLRKVIARMSTRPELAVIAEPDLHQNGEPVPK